MALFGKGPHMGASGKHYFNPKVMENKGDTPNEGHPEIHHIEIHPHGPSSEHPHHVEVHKHDGSMEHGGEHENYDMAAEAGKSNIDGMDSGQEPGEEAEEMNEHPEMNKKVGHTGGGAY